MLRKLLLAAAIVLVALPAPADTITQWTFNSVPPDNPAVVSTGTTNPAVGSGAASLAPEITSTFATGNPNSTGDNSGWNTVPLATSVSPAPPVTATDPLPKTRYVQFLVSTVGYMGIGVLYDHRASNTAPNTAVFQYTTDGLTWNDFASYKFAAAEVWEAKTYDLTSVLAADNNPNFGIRIAADIDPAVGNYYGARTTIPTEATRGGTWRFDNVTITGTIVPEPGSLVALSVSLLGLAGARRRRSR